jgi:Mg2+/Co2+ transporter CorB
MMEAITASKAAMLKSSESDLVTQQAASRKANRPRTTEEQKGDKRGKNEERRGKGGKSAQRSTTLRNASKLCIALHSVSPLLFRFVVPPLSSHRTPQLLHR